MSRVLKNLIRCIATVGLVWIVAMSFESPLRAQLSKGAISGTVIDAQNAAIEAVQVKVTDQATRLVQATKTNDVGHYLVVAEPGSYTIEFTKDGFQPWKAANIAVASGRDTVINPPLKVGTVSTEVEVTAPGIELDKTSATIRLHVPGRIPDEIPMSSSSLVPGGSRNVTRTILLAPGIARVLFQNEASANGHRGRENNNMVDGTDNNDQSLTLPALFVPPEAVEEMDIQSASFTAEYGHSIGGQINVITKRGTNSYRGELWEFYRGNALEPLALSDRKSGLTTTPRLVDNQFGGSLGGPITKKTFFFGLLQGNLLRTGPRASSTATIPTPAGYAVLLAAPLRSGQSAASRQAALDAISFLPAVHSTIQNYSNVTSTSQSINSVPIEVGQFSAVLPTRQNIWYSTIRVDHQLTDNDRLTYRGHIDQRNSPLNTGNLAFGDRWAVDNKYFAQNHFLGYSKTVGSNFFNEARVTYTRLFPSLEERDKVTPTTTLTSLFTIGSPNNFPQERLEQTWQFQNVSTYLLSRHSLKLGVDLARTRLDSNTGQHLRGTWVFPDLQSFMYNQAQSLNYLAGAPQKFTFHQLRQAYFVQDDFKLTPNFTTNIGMRYETSNIPLGFFGATTTDALSAGVPGPVRRDTNNWGPRAGFVYSPQVASGLLGKLFGEGKSAIRAGFGVSYDVLFYSLPITASSNYPRNDLQTYTSGLLDQFPILPPKITSPTFNIMSEFINLPSDAQNPTSNYWSLSIQRQIHTDFTIEVGYSGNRSYHLIRQSQNNPTILSAAQAATVIATCTSANLGSCQNPTPPRLNTSWGPRRSLETTGEASYNSVYLQVNARTRFGLRLGANYTLSANLSDSEEFSNDAPNASDGGLASSSPQVPQDFFNRRNEWSRSVFDRPHRVAFHYTYEIPWFRSSPMLLTRVFGGWQWSGFTELQSGQPFTIKIGVDAVGNGLTGVGSARPDYNPGGILIADPATGNLRTFFIPRDGTGIVTAPHVTDPVSGAITFLKNSMPTGGTLGRNTFRGPGYANFNMSLAKRITLPGERQLQIRGDFINVFNHDNFPNPDSNMTSSTFGKQFTSRLLTDARQVLLGVKLAF